MYAPVFITVYNRLTHLKRCIESLLNCPESKFTTVYIASDAAATSEDEKVIANVRDYIKSISGFKEVIPLLREKNIGAINNSYTGRDHIFETNDCLIRLEDDVVVGKGFLKFINDGLIKYKDDEKVIGVCGYLPPGVNNQKGHSFFLQSRAPYGFGMWRNKEYELLKSFDKNYMESLFSEKVFFKEFERTHPHVARAIPLIVNGDFMPGDVMAAIIMQARGLTALYPPTAISVSRGNDGSGMHSGKNNKLQNQMPSDEVCSVKLNLNISVNKKMEEKLSTYYRFTGVRIVNYIVYLFYRLPGGYFLYKLSRRLVKKIRKLFE